MEKIPPGADAIGRQISALHDQRIGQDNKKFRNREGVRFHPGIVFNDVGRDHFSSELARLSAIGSVPRGITLGAIGPGKMIPADWDDHPQIKAIVELAKAAEAATITPAEKVMAAEESATRAQEHADRLSKIAEVAKARAAYHK